MGETDLLPYARSQIAVPLRSRGAALGAIEACSYQSDTFDEELAIVLQVIADQVAVAIDSIRLAAENRAAAEQLHRAYGELTRDAWRSALGSDLGGGYVARLTGVEPLAAMAPEQWPPQLQRAWRTGQPVVVDASEGGEAPAPVTHLVFPIFSRDRVIGVLDAARLLSSGKDQEITTLTQTLEALAGQLGQALENARLYEVTQRAALEEQMVGDVTRRMRETLSVDAVLQTAARELRSLFNLEAVEIRMGGPLLNRHRAGEGEGWETVSEDPAEHAGSDGGAYG